MSFLSFSKSSRKGHYPHYNHGSDYYRRSSKHSGLMDMILNAIFSKKRRSYSYSDQYHNQWRKHRSWS